MVIEHTVENRKNIERTIKRYASELFQEDCNVSVSWGLSSTEGRFTGIFASIFVSHSSITINEKEYLQNYGLYELEQSSHPVLNKDMDSSAEISRDNYDYAVETETELIVELGPEFTLD